MSPMKPSPRRQLNSFLRTPHLCDGTSDHPAANTADVTSRRVNGPVLRRTEGSAVWRLARRVKREKQRVLAAWPREPGRETEVAFPANSYQQEARWREREAKRRSGDG